MTRLVDTRRVTRLVDTRRVTRLVDTRRVTRLGCIFSRQCERKLWCHRRPAGGEQQSTGLLHLNDSSHRHIHFHKKRPHFRVVFFYGAGDEARTRYLHLGKVALYRMSYTRGTRSIIAQLFHLSTVIFKKYPPISKKSEGSLYPSVCAAVVSGSVVTGSVVSGAVVSGTALSG